MAYIVDDNVQKNNDCKSFFTNKILNIQSYFPVKVIASTFDNPGFKYFIK